jgi:hypothetical protein
VVVVVVVGATLLRLLAMQMRAWRWTLTRIGRNGTDTTPPDHQTF